MIYRIATRSENSQKRRELVILTLIPMLEINKMTLLLPSAKRWFIEQNEDWILQKDRKYRSRLYTEWKVESSINGRHSRLMLILSNVSEHIHMKQKLHRRQVFTVKQLLRQIRQIWRSLPHQYAVNLVQSMPRSCQSIIYRRCWRLNSLLMLQHFICKNKLNKLYYELSRTRFNRTDCKHEISIYQVIRA